MFQELREAGLRAVHEPANRERAEVVARIDELWRRGWVPPSKVLAS